MVKSAFSLIVAPVSAVMVLTGASVVMNFLGRSCTNTSHRYARVVLFHQASPVSELVESNVVTGY